MTDWIPLGNIRGPQGAQGPQGVQGPQGQTGPQGQNGMDGAQGPQGIQGPTGQTGVQGPQGDAGERGYTPMVQIKEVNSDVSHLLVYWLEQPIPFDINDPTTYVELQENIKGPAGAQGVAGSGIGTIVIPPTYEADTWCYVANKLFDTYKSITLDTWNDNLSAFNTIMAIGVNIPQFNFSLLLNDFINYLNQESVDYLSSPAYKTYAVEWLYCKLVSVGGEVSLQTLNYWLAEWGATPNRQSSVNLQTSTNDPINVQILMDAKYNLDTFKLSLSQLSYQSRSEVAYTGCRDLPCTQQQQAWGVTFNFLSSQQGWVNLNGVGYWQQNFGFGPECGNIPELDGNQANGCVILREFPEVITIDFVGLIFDYSAPSNNFGWMKIFTSTDGNTWSLKKYVQQNNEGWYTGLNVRTWEFDNPTLASSIKVAFGTDVFSCNGAFVVKQLDMGGASGGPTSP